MPAGRPLRPAGALERLADDRRPQALGHLRAERVVEAHERPRRRRRGPPGRARASASSAGTASRSASQRGLDGSPVALESRHAHGRRHPQRRAVGEFGAGIGGLASRSRAPARRVRRRRRGAPAPRRGEGGGVGPPAQARLPDPQIVGEQHPIAVEEDDRAVSARGDRLGAPRRDDERRAGVDVGDRVRAVGDDDPRAGEGAAEFVGGALAPGGCHAHAGRRAVGARPAGRRAAAPRALRHRALPGGVQRAAAVRTASGMPALGADQHGGVAGAGDLDEHRSVRERLAGGGERRGRHPGAARLALAGGAQHHARARAARRGRPRAPTPPRRGARRRWCGCARRTAARSRRAPAAAARRLARARRG